MIKKIEIKSSKSQFCLFTPNLVQIKTKNRTSSIAIDSLSPSPSLLYLLISLSLSLSLSLSSVLETLFISLLYSQGLVIVPPPAIGPLEAASAALTPTPRVGYYGLCFGGCGVADVATTMEVLGGWKFGQWLFCVLSARKMDECPSFDLGFCAI
ncbi:hypothetical protein CFOL_v3_13485 [Cephalotus follicularis]|uniref:Uncharacterized protein n=1 Tax=Cephalotus follicularis TaxID=3775 RepID=A0A1Q3BPM6_CEPFO|nr:hypothetical protein CFOL_v3_13485 [Cephalotus follicularis]